MSRLTLVAAVGTLFTPVALEAQTSAFTLFGSVPPPQLPAEQRFVHPITSPYYAEDSFIGSDVRLWYAYQDLPKGGLIAGGNADVYAAQIRIALSDQFQLVAYKDGFLQLHSHLVDNDGWNDLAAGIKWNFLQDAKDQLFAAVGVGYEFPIGDAKVLQNDQEIRIWGSIDKGFDRLHLGFDVNCLLQVGPSDALGNSDRLLWNAHGDYFINRWFSPVVELNGYHKLDKNREAVPFSGADIADLGGGDDVITAGVGVEFRLKENVALRAAYEIPLTDGTDLFGSRVTTSLVYSF